MDFESYYDLLNEESIRAIQEDQYAIDKLISSESDRRFGITLLIRLNEQTNYEIQQFLTELKAIDPYQYYYPSSGLHITVLSIISCYQGFTLSKINTDQYVNLLLKELDLIKCFNVELKGAIFSKSGILVKGFPEAMLNEIRDRLRINFKKASLQHSIDSRYEIKAAHSTIMRFRKQLHNKEKLIAKTSEYKNFHFGKLSVDSLELVYNDWYLKQEKTKTIKKIQLKPA